MVIVLKADVRSESPEVAANRRPRRELPRRDDARARRAGRHALAHRDLPARPDARRPDEPFEEFEAVEKVVRITEKFRAIGRHDGQPRRSASSTTASASARTRFHVFPGLCAVDTRENVEAMFRALARARHRHHARRRLQAAHQPVRLPGARRGLPALRVRARRQVRHQGHRHGDHARVAHRRDPRRARSDGQRRPA